MRLTSKVMKFPLVRASFVTTVGTVASSIINIALFTVLLRHISFADYGTYASLFAIGGIATFLSPSLNLYFTKLGSYLKNRYGKEFIQGKFFAYSIGITVAVLFLGGTIIVVQNKLQNENTYLWFVVGLTLVGLLQPLVDGLLRGLQLFSLLSVISILGAAIKALAVGLTILLIPSLTTILTAILCSFFFIYIISLLAYRNFFQRIHSSSLKSKQPLQMPNLIQLTLVTLLLNSFINADIIVVKQFFQPTLAGMYAAQMNLAKTILYANAILSPIFFSLISDSIIKGLKEIKLGKQTVLMSIVITFGMIIVFYFFSPVIFKVIFQKTITNSENFVWILAIGTGFYSLSDILVHYLVSHNRTNFVGILFFVTLLQVVLLVLFHGSISMLVLVVVVMHIVLFLALMREWLHFTKAKENTYG